MIAEPRWGTSMTFPLANRILRSALFAAMLAAFGLVAAPIPPAPEQILPADTLLVLSAPDTAKLRQSLQQFPTLRLWQDPLMKPFREKFLAGWNKELVTPLERELGFDASQWTNMFQGQATFALVPGEKDAPGKPPVGFVFLCGIEEQSQGFATNFYAWRRKGIDSGRVVREHKIRGVTFTVVQLATNEVPTVLRSFMPRKIEAQKPDEDEFIPAHLGPSQVFLGPAGGLFLVANSAAALETILTRMEGGKVPALAEQGAYKACHAARFLGAPVYGWLHSRNLLDALASRSSPSSSVSPSSAVEEVSVEKLLRAAGFGEVQTISFSLHHLAEGMAWELHVGLPEGSRPGIFSLLTGQPGEWGIPAFLPADAIKFQRWRVDAKQTLLVLGNILTAAAPTSINGLNAIVTTAQDAARLQDPAFDLTKTLTASLGDDLMVYQKVWRAGSTNAQEQAASVWLLGSSKPGELVASLKWLLLVLSESPQARDFLGSQILSVPMPPLHQLWGGEPPAGPPATLCFAASKGYVALSTSAPLLEEHLRNVELQGPAPRDASGFIEASKKVTGPGTRWFAFHQRAETLRSDLKMWQADPGSFQRDSANMSAITALLGLVSPESSIKDWMDVRLLPPVEQVVPYFHFTLQAASASPDGLTLRYFAPTPPRLKTASATGS